VADSRNSDQPSLDQHDDAGSSASQQPEKITQKFTLEPADARRLATLCGQFDDNIHQIEQRLNVAISNRGHAFAMAGNRNDVNTAQALLQSLYSETANGRDLTPDQVHLALQEASLDKLTEPGAANTELTLIRTQKCTVKPRGLNQQKYVRAVQSHDINFGIGPAGTGKTYLPWPVRWSVC